jgi:hypothetical protein
MKNPYQRKAASRQSTAAYDPKKIYKTFLEQMVINTSVIALYHDGWALCATPTGQRAFAIWQNKSLAKLLIKDNWENYEIQEVSLKDLIEKVIPFLREENTVISMNLTPEGQNLLITPDRFLLDIKNYLYQIYVQRPDFFTHSGIPLPRSIRLN